MENMKVQVFTDYSVMIFEFDKKEGSVKIDTKKNIVEIKGKIIKQKVFDRFKDKISEIADGR